MLQLETYAGILRMHAVRTKSLLKGLEGQDILVTGASGLIGAAVTDFLACASDELGLDIQVYAGCRQAERMKNRFGMWGSVHLVEYQALDWMAKGVSYDAIIHCAGIAHPRAYQKHPVETMQVNFMGINGVLEYAREVSGSCRVLYVSSSEVYGNRPSGDAAWYRETDYNGMDILNTRACYPLGKQAAEALCMAYREEYGLETVIVRPGHVYGATMTSADSRASSAFIRNVLEGCDILMKSPGQQLRSYCYVTDCVTAILTVLEKGMDGEAYNISNINSVATIRQFADELAAQTGKKVIFENPSDEERKGYNQMNLSALDAGKLEKLGWHGVYTLEDGIRETLGLLGYPC